MLPIILFQTRTGKKKPAEAGQSLALSRIASPQTLLRYSQDVRNSSKHFLPVFLVEPETTYQLRLRLRLFKKLETTLD